MSLALPWEVIERVIEHCYDSHRALYNFSISCRQLRALSLTLLVADVEFKHREQIFSLCDLLRAKPHLQPLVRTMSVYPTDLVPCPLLDMLTNLNEIVFTDRRFGTGSDQSAELHRPTVVLNQSTLTCCGRVGTHLQTIQFFRVTFATDLELSRLLSAFPHVSVLTLEDVAIKTNASAPLVATNRQRLSRRLQLRTLHIDIAVHDAVVAFILESAQFTAQTLIFTVADIQQKALSHPLNWSRLHTLSLRSEFEPEKVKKIAEFLKVFHPPNLKDVALMLTGYIRTAIELLRGEDASNLGCSLLEHELLRFPKPALTFSADEPALHPRRALFWTRELGQHFPAMRDRNAFSLESESTTAVGHDNAATCLAIAPDSQRIASGSWDSTIILWDAAGQIVHEWVAHPGGVRSLAFSPDSQRLVSAGMDEKLAVWDLGPASGGARRLATLAGHTHWVSSCAWSPDGSTIASACDEAGRPRAPPPKSQLESESESESELELEPKSDPDGQADAGQASDSEPLDVELDAYADKTMTIRLWDARPGTGTAFAQRHVLAGGAHPKAIYFVLFSPNGRWLASGGDDCHVCVWDVSPSSLQWSDAPHAVLRGHRHRLQAAAFHPDGVRLGTAAQDCTACIWRVDTGEELLVLRGHEGWVYDIAFSPNGGLALTASEDGTASAKGAVCCHSRSLQTKMIATRRADEPR
ncbi:hypothetical protein GSI_01466 [Ganoderma sinense ZZ0214-1]|uniref:Uncharacterized protein n=1 Tax=Ganoderma sinense ZZ0214-1 TaxID=1077348 RepID=A0A2G8SPW2_9APHY|nr:hypothetical protein GSI_01466 [Ganoderma sinense ZZ0214-1]